ncbi:MAG TPA: hypothetical protein VFY27_02400 [Woeseiaceae bacterium]|nr:hypothetical protein [Woeseiaceae bacterium]
MPDTETEQDETMISGLGVRERELLHARLRQLPETMPPRAVWQRIEAQARAEGLLKTSLPRRLKLVAGAGLAATVVLAVVGVQDARNGAESETFPTVPSYSEQNNVVALNTLNALMVQSQELEEDLRALPSQPQLVRAGTAATIAGLEDQIAAIDYRLNEPSIRMSHEQMEVYWRERVRLMNLLVQLRAAQAQRNGF